MRVAQLTVNSMMKRNKYMLTFIGLVLGAVTFYWLADLPGRISHSQENAKLAKPTNEPSTVYKDRVSESVATTDSLPIIVRPSGFDEEPRTEVVESGRYRCRYDTGVDNFSLANLVVFYHRDVRYYKIPPHKNQQQLWAFVLKEPQVFLGPTDLSNWNGVFNYSATFLRDNDGSFHIFRAKLEKVHPKGTAYFTSELKKHPVRALWFVSHCTTKKTTYRINSAREEYVLELSKYINIDIFTSPDRTSCSERFRNVPNISLSSDESHIGGHMFYLSFENNLCKDYISEKFWRVLESNDTMIPVALGGLTIEDYEAVAPPNSFIHVRNFTSPRALAEHLTYVSQDDSAFHYYHQWRNEYRLVSRHIKNKIHYLYHGDHIEYFCELLHTRPQRVIYNMNQESNSKDCIMAALPKIHCPYYNFTCNKRFPGKTDLNH